VLTPGGAVSLLIDARQSNALPRRLASVDPPEGASGDHLTLTGSGLSGRNVAVTFGAVALPGVAQPFASRFTVTVPAGLAPGPATVRVTVDGFDTNALPFLVRT
jgi:IPT/TIG domain